MLNFYDSCCFFVVVVAVVTAVVVVIILVLSLWLFCCYQDRNAIDIISIYFRPSVYCTKVSFT